MQRLHVDGRRGGCHASRSENLGSSALELRLSCRNLIGMGIKLIGQLSYRSVALHGGKCHLGALKAGVWFRRGRLLTVSPNRGDYRRRQAEIPLIVLFKFAEPALDTTGGASPVAQRPDQALRKQATNWSPRPSRLSCSARDM
jgi:hypothetical protein